MIPQIEEGDGIRQIWSLLRHKSKQVRVAAAWTLVPLLRNTPDSGEIVKFLIGGFDLVIELLKSQDNEILAGNCRLEIPICKMLCLLFFLAACALLAEIATDLENLNVLTHFELIPLLTRLFNSKNDQVQENLSHLIAKSCFLEANTKELTRSGALSMLIKYLQSPKISVQKSAVIALSEMSKNPFNCVTIKDSGIDNLLKKYIETYDDLEMQTRAANTLKNIRTFCFQAEISQCAAHKSDTDSDKEMVVLRRKSSLVGFED